MLEKTDIKLTEREIEVLILLAEGKTNKEISKVLNITVHTVKAHLLNIYEKLNINSRVQAAIIAAQIGIINI